MFLSPISSNTCWSLSASMSAFLFFGVYLACWAPGSLCPSCEASVYKPSSSWSYVLQQVSAKDKAKDSSNWRETAKAPSSQWETAKDPINQWETAKDPSSQWETEDDPSSQWETENDPSSQQETEDNLNSQRETAKITSGNGDSLKQTPSASRMWKNSGRYIFGPWT